jgi:hypothetical protein
LKDLLGDVVRQAAPLFDKVRVTGGNGLIKVEAHTDDQMLFLVAKLPADMPDLDGEFGISNLQLLRGLLDFASYKADDAKFHVRRTQRDTMDYVSELEFDGQGGRAVFKTINPKMIGEKASIAEIAWDVEVAPSKAKLTEVMQLTSMLAQIDQHFAVSYTNRTVQLTVGGKAATSHNATVALATDVDGGPLPAKMIFKAPQFLSVLKNVGNWPCLVRFTKVGLASVLVTTNHGTYNYILRGIET